MAQFQSRVIPVPPRAGQTSAVIQFSFWMPAEAAMTMVISSGTFKLSQNLHSRDLRDYSSNASKDQAVCDQLGRILEFWNWKYGGVIKLTA